MPPSEKSREHNQGRQDRDFTPEQKSAVDRVRKCKPTAYYEILDIETKASDGEVKKAYRRLALVMHPDKNGAPGADEAFKMVSRAFQVLSDPQKRATYDRTGGDPDTRGFPSSSGGGGGGGGSPFGNGFPGGARGGQMFTDEISPEDLFNMFFGGGGLGGGFNGGLFADGGPGFMNFGGPGIRIHQFGGPRVRRAGGGGGGAGPRPGQTGDIPPEEPNLWRTITQLLPLILLFILPILSSLWGEATSSYPSGPTFKFHRTPPYTLLRTTPKHKIPYYVDPSEILDVKPNILSNLGHRVEVKYLNDLSAECNYEMAAKQRALEEARGWIWTDQVKEKKAREMGTPSCDRLRQFGYAPGYRY